MDQIGGHWYPPALSGDLKGSGFDCQARDGYRWMRILVRFYVEIYKYFRPVFRFAHAVVLAVKIKGPLFPQSQDQVDALKHSCPFAFRIRDNAEHLVVAGSSPGTNTEYETSLSQVVKHRYAVRKLDRFVKMYDCDPGPESNLIGLTRCPGYKELRRRNIFPRQCHMLADPGFAEA